MRRVHAKKTATVGPEHLDGLQSRHRPDHDVLRLGLTLVRGPHCRLFKRRDIMRALKGHGTALHQKDKGEDQGNRQKRIDHHAPHVHKIVAKFGRTAKSPDHGHEGAEADSGRYEHIPDAKENLTEVRQMLIPGIVLQISVRHERDHAVKDGGGKEHALAVGIQRHPGLERQHQIAEDKHHNIEDQQGTGILLPVLRTAVQAFFAPAQYRQGPVFSIHDPGQVLA